MNYQHLSIFTVVISVSLSAMESPLGILIEDSIETIKAAMLAKIETKEQAEELLDASNKMIEEHKKFIRNKSELATLSVLLNTIRSHCVSPVIEWLKEVQILENQFAQSRITAHTLQQFMDETLEGSDGDVSHSTSVELREELTKLLVQYNTFYQVYIQKLSELFGSQLTNIQFQKFLTLDEFKQQVKKEKITEDKLLRICAYKEFLEEEAPHQLEFFHLALKIQTILGLPIKNNTTENMNPNLRSQLLKYCTESIQTLQNKLLGEIIKAVQLNGIKPTENKKLIKHTDKQKLEDYKLLFEEEYKAYRNYFDELSHYKKHLNTQFLSHLKIYIDRFEKCGKELLSEKEKSKKTIQPKSMTVVTCKDISSLPPCRIDIKPHSAADIHRLKQKYPYFMQFRLQKDILNELTQQKTSILYFLSKNILTTKPTGTPTSTFIYEIGKTPMNQLLPVKDNRLYYTNEGNYYFINHADSSEKAYPIEYIAALCFPAQQSTQAKIEPQVRNSSDNKE